jgi:4-oxalocrotonate tautomerase
MPIANILILEGRAVEAKQALIRAVTAAIADTLKAKPESIRVILHEVPRQNWGIGGVSAQELGR